VKDLIEGGSVMTAHAMLVILSLTLSCIWNPNEAEGGRVQKIACTIQEAVTKTEEGYVVTDKGTFLLTGRNTEVILEDEDADKIDGLLHTLIGKRCTLHLYTYGLYHEKAVVGIQHTASGTSLLGRYRVQERRTYTSPALELKTVLLRWNQDTYRLTVRTKDGELQIPNEYEFRNYQERVKEKLRRRCPADTDVSIPITVIYHDLGDRDWPWYLEDIKFEKRRAGRGADK
jgi:hypothetical protein